MALRGAGRIFRQPRYVLIFAGFFLIFGTVLSLLNAGTTEIGLLFSSIPLGDKLSILANVVLRIFTNPTVLVLAILQATIFSMLIFVWRAPKLKICRKNDTESAGIGAILTLFGAGCPACGISIVTPLVTTAFSTGAYAAVAVFGAVALILAFVVSLFTFIHLGKDVNNVVKT